MELSNEQWGVLVFHVLLVWPLWRVYGRAGLPRGWAFLGLVPVFGLGLALAPLALMRWPNGSALRRDGAARPVRG